MTPTFDRNDLRIALGVLAGLAYLAWYLSRPPCHGSALLERDVDPVTHAVTLRVIPERSEHGCRVSVFGR